MELRVIGCHGGETPKHRTSGFLVDECLAIDAGSLATGLDLALQFGLVGCVISHAHLDHIKDLATVADNRCQADCEPLPVAATRGTIRTLKKHFFNNVLWPDFTSIPNTTHPTIRFVEMKPERKVDVGGYEVQCAMVNHTIESAGFVVRGEDATVAYSGDTGPTDKLWPLLRKEPDLRALLMEVSFPNREQKRTDFALEMPGMLSIGVGGSTETEVAGLNDFPEEEWPPLLMSFFSFHFMVGLGFYFIGLTALGLFLLWRQKLHENRLFLRVALLSIPLPVIANELGWIAAEVGRQPWIVYGLMRTDQAFSTAVSAGEILASLVMFSVIYTLLFCVWIFLLRRKLLKGPESEVATEIAGKEASA